MYTSIDDLKRYFNCQMLACLVSCIDTWLLKIWNSNSKILFWSRTFINHILFVLLKTLSISCFDHVSILVVTHSEFLKSVTFFTKIFNVVWNGYVPEMTSDWMVTNQKQIRNKSDETPFEINYLQSTLFPHTNVIANLRGAYFLKKTRFK